MKLIDRDELLATLEQDINVSVTGEENMEAVRRCLQEILDDVKESPVVDAVEVIRCKDCKYLMMTITRSQGKQMTSVVGQREKTMRLIDADALAKFIDYGHLNNPDEKHYSENDIREMIDMMPTVDAVPVRHGKWLPENRTMDAYWVCSCCGFPSEAHGAFKIYKYCPNCGARMRDE